jgi:uncharacterized protein YyaL (SSP411 family)
MREDSLSMTLLRRLLPLALAALAAAPLAHAQPIAWQPWSDEAFARARREHKFVLLDLEAVWCHWCHVMDATTYRDPRVQALLASRYVALRVDQDSRPDLANRYEDYGWPATVIYAADGTEIVKKQGYVEPAGMARLLQAVIDDPSPVNYHDGQADAAASGPATLAAERVAVLRRQWLGGYDDKAGGWGFGHKFLDWDNVEYALREAAGGDERAARMARDTLRLQRKLLDPVWGGMYQYSVDGDWNEPHFEKIMPMQAEDLRVYALAYAQWGDPADLATARAILGYLRGFLTAPDGAFYVSQDADLVAGEHSAEYFALDDAGRRARGLPRVDTHRYARENGWAIAGLAQFAAVTGDAGVRRDAEAAAQWVLAHRALPGGGFRHDERDPAGPYLGDTLAMGRAFLALHQLTADPAWLTRAEGAADFIRGHFGRGAAAGFASSDTRRPSFPAPRPEFDENVAVARFGAALGNASGRADDRAMAAAALRWLLAPGVGEPRHAYVGGLLLAEDEASTDPLHVAVVGGKDDPAAAALYAVALRAPTAHKLIEWWDRREGPAPRGEDIYPDLPEPAAFVCANGACSTPISAAPALALRLRKILSAPPRS